MHCILIDVNIWKDEAACFERLLGLKFTLDLK